MVRVKTPIVSADSMVNTLPSDGCDDQIMNRLCCEWKLVNPMRCKRFSAAGSGIKFRWNKDYCYVFPFFFSLSSFQMIPHFKWENGAGTEVMLGSCCML